MVKKKCGDHWFVIERTYEQIGDGFFYHTAMFCHHCGDIREIVTEPAEELPVQNTRRAKRQIVKEPVTDKRAR
jgi:hypothetical protein